MSNQITTLDLPPNDTYLLNAVVCSSQLLTANSAPSQNPNNPTVVGDGDFIWTFSTPGGISCFSPGANAITLTIPSKNNFRCTVGTDYLNCDWSAVLYKVSGDHPSVVSPSPTMQDDVDVLTPVIDSFSVPSFKFKKMDYSYSSSKNSNNSDRTSNLYLDFAFFKPGANGGNPILVGYFRCQGKFQILA